MISAISLYQDAARDSASGEENGDLSYEMFNRLLERAQVWLLKYITGSEVENNDFPFAYNKQKLMDYKKPFINQFKFNNDFQIPADYFTFDNMYLLTKKNGDCEDDVTQGCNIPIRLLDSKAFYNRCNSYIKPLRPSAGNPIAKIVNNRIEMMPTDVGSGVLEYIRYPKAAFINVVMDTVLNIPVPDPATTKDLEWDEWAREPLIWFIVDRFATSTRERAAKENSMADKPKI